MIDGYLRWVQIMLLLTTAATAAAESDQPPKTLQHLLVIEAETDIEEGDAPGPFLRKHDEASGEGYVTPVPWPHRIYEPFEKPVELSTEVDVPVAGRWYAHVRYRVTPETQIRHRTYREATEHLKHFHPFGAFEVAIGGRRFTVGADQARGAEFRWDRFAVDLPAGRTPVTFSMPHLAGPDCLVLTPTADYEPAISDWTGPIWLRFKVTDGADNPFFIRTRCHFNPSEVRSRELRTRDAGWLFKGVVASTEAEAEALEQDPQALLSEGEWSPWVRTFTAERNYFYAQVMFMPGPQARAAGAAKRGLDEIELTYQAATRPDEAFLVGEGDEFTGTQRGPFRRGAFILLPTEQGLDARRRQVRSFSQWAEDRLDHVAQLDLAYGQGPRRIGVTTMTEPLHTPREVEVYIETLRRLGYNGLEVRQKLVDPHELWQRVADDGFTWTHAHHLAPVFRLKKWLDLPAESALPDDKTAQQVVDDFLYERSLERIHKLWDDRPEVERRMIALANLVDEPGPSPHFVEANCVPAIRRSFHDFLRDHDVSPAFLGKQTWDQVDLIGYQRHGKRGLPRLLKQLNIDLEYVTPDGPIAADDLLHYEQVAGEEGEPPRYRVRVPVIKGLRDADIHEKRHYYWSQRFRSFFTRHFYGQTARAVRTLSDEGYLPSDILITPNFQAEPMMKAQMWDGGLNLFEWARAGTTNALMLEDWIKDPYRVGFGQAILNAAARKHDQSIAHLIVADRHFRRRYLTALAMGTQMFVDYLYGPMGTQGPAWSNQADAARDRAEMLRRTRRCEDDLLASRLRPADTAILVANTAEINTAYYNAAVAETGIRAAGRRPLFRRAGIYAALLDAGVPVEIVSEEEILEDRALERYKALYVTDTHVATPVQEAIKAWVHAGGTLWADHTALARDQYDEDSDVMTEVFGLTSRGALPDPALQLPKDAPAHAIHVTQSATLDDVDFAGSLVRPTWTLSTAEALAMFDDDSPALTLNTFGQGRAVLLGCSALSLSPYATQSADLPEFDKARRVVTLGADLAGAVRHCRVSVPRVPAYVRDGPEQTVLVLLNSHDAPLTDVEVRLTVPHKVQSAFDARGNAVAFQQEGDQVRFTRDLAEDDGEIVIFKW